MLKCRRGSGMLSSSSTQPPTAEFNEKPACGNVGVVELNACADGESNGSSIESKCSNDAGAVRGVRGERGMVPKTGGLWERASREGFWRANCDAISRRRFSMGFKAPDGTGGL